MPEDQRAAFLAAMDRDDPGQPEVAAQLEGVLQWFYQNGQAASPASSGVAPAAAPAPVAAGSGTQGTQGTQGAAAGSVADKYRRKK
jgi:hypothetical protein